MINKKISSMNQNQWTPQTLTVQIHQPHLKNTLESLFEKFLTKSLRITNDWSLSLTNIILRRDSIKSSYFSEQNLCTSFHSLVTSSDISLINLKLPKALLEKIVLRIKELLKNNSSTDSLILLLFHWKKFKELQKLTKNKRTFLNYLISFDLIVSQSLI